MSIVWQREEVGVTRECEFLCIARGSPSVSSSRKANRVAERVV